MQFHTLALTQLFLTLATIRICTCNPDANRLYEDLLSDYNKLVRPVYNNSETLVVNFKLKLSQLLDVHEKNQIMTTNVWLQHSWVDYKLKWNPADYGGVEVLYVPSELIWLPDIVLYNNADGNYQVTIMTKAKLSYNGTVEWSPPAIYKSMCQIDVEWFPFDNQTCEMKFGSWTYGGLEVDLIHKDQDLQQNTTKEVPSLNNGFQVENIWVVLVGVDLNDYYQSVEWDILGVPGIRHEKRYPCCDSPFIDITYEIRLRRKTLFYTVNLIVPSVGISFLTALVFYLPSDSGEKISLCISILISLTVFFLLLVEIIPSTSLVIPLIGKYLLFTMVLVTLSVIVTVITLNVHYRSPTTHTMPAWIRRAFLEYLPKLLCISRPTADEQKAEMAAGVEARKHFEPSNPATQSYTFVGADASPRFDKRRLSTIEPLTRRRSPNQSFTGFLSADFAGSGGGSGMLFPAVNGAAAASESRKFDQEHTPMHMAVESVCYIADHLKSSNDDDEVIEDWKYVAMVLDRLFLWLFTLSCAAGTFSIILRAPSIHDTRTPIA